MGFRRVVHDRVMPRNDLVEQLGVADVAVHELHTIAQDRTDVLQVARIRQRIQHRHMHVRMIVVHVMHEVRPDKTTATGHNDVMRSKHFISHTSESYKDRHPNLKVFGELWGNTVIILTASSRSEPVFGGPAHPATNATIR